MCPIEFPRTTLDESPVKLTLEGDYAEIVDFLGRIERLPPTIWVRNLQLQAQQQQKGEAGQRLRCELSLTVFADISGNAGQASRPNTSRETPGGHASTAAIQ